MQSAVTARTSPGARLTGTEFERAEGPAGAMGDEMHHDRGRGVIRRLVLEAGDGERRQIEGADADLEHGNGLRIGR